MRAPGHPNPPQSTVLLTANSAWNLAHFRRPLIEGLAAAGYRVAVAAPPGDDLDGMTHVAGRHPVSMDRGGLNPFADAKTYRAYRRLLAATRPAAALGFTVKPNIYGALAAARSGIAFIPNVSGLGTAFLRGGMLQRLVVALYRRAFRRCPRVFFQNDEDHALFLKLAIVREGQGRVLPGSGIDLSRFSPMPRHGDGVTRFLLIARLLGDKGIREYAEAARIIRAEYPDTRFDLLGPFDPDNRSAIGRDEVVQWSADGAINYLGEADDVRPYIADCDALVLPSYREGLPRTLLEGAAMARPLIASDVPGCRALVEDGKNGLLFEARSANALADAFRKFLATSPAERDRMGSAARTVAETRFDERIVVQAYLDALSELAHTAR